MNLDAGTAGDTINITGTASGVTTTVNAGAGDDIITAGSAGLLDGILGTLTIHGQGHTTADTLHLDDSAQASAQTYTLNAASFTRTGLATINFDTVETVNLDAGTAGDTINITGTASGVTTTVNAGAGDDIITLISNVTGSSVILHGDANDDTLNIRSVATGSTVQAFGDADNDTFNVGNTSNKLDDIQGNLTISGGTHAASPPGDTVFFNDGGQAADNTYTLTGTTLTRSGLPNPITFGTVETIEVDSGAGNDKLIVNFSAYPASPTLTVKFDGGSQPSGGMDTLRLNGTAGNDTMKVGTFGSGLPFQIQNVECLQMFGNAGADNLENDTAVSSLIDGGDGADTLVGGSATDVIFGGDGVDIIYGRGGNDFLFGDHEFNNRSPRVKHSAKGDKIYGDQGLFVGDPFATNPGVDKIVAIGVDTISAGGQVGDTIVGLGLHITVVDWLKARFLKPNSANIQAVINQALAQPCTMI